MCNSTSVGPHEAEQPGVPSCLMGHQSQGTRAHPTASGNRGPQLNPGAPSQTREKGGEEGGRGESRGPAWAPVEASGISGCSWLCMAVPSNVLFGNSWAV